MSMENWHNLYQQVAQDKPSPWREKAWQQFIDAGFPRRGDEAWKYTDTSAIAVTSFSLSNNASRQLNLPEKIPNTTRLVFVNGSYSVEYSDPCDDDAVTIMPILEAIEAHQLQSKFNMKETSQFTALNAALCQGGVYIHVHKNQRVKNALHLMHIQTEFSEHPAQFVRHIVQAESHSEIEIFESYCFDQSATELYFNNQCTKIYAEPGALVSHYRLQNECQSAYHVGNIDVYQKENSTVKTYHFNFGAQLARHDLNYHFLEKGAYAEIIGLYCSHTKQHLDTHTQMNHHAPHCVSDQSYRGVMSDQSHAVFNGKILVAKDAQKTEAYLNNRNLLLSKSAQVDTKPELEIYADDVKCAHGATVGCMDENALFYLRSRCIDKQTAQRLLIQAFLSELLEKMPNTDIQAYIKSVVEDEF